MSTLSQTFNFPLRRSVHHSGSFAAIGARLWLHVIASIKARLVAAAQLRAERELLALADFYETSMPTFAAELRAANCRR